MLDQGENGVIVVESTMMLKGQLKNPPAGHPVRRILEIPAGTPGLLHSATLDEPQVLVEFDLSGAFHLMEVKSDHVTRL